MLRNFYALLAMAVTFVLGTLPAAAEDYTYAPTGCDFQMVFPEQPLTQQQCSAKDPKQCHQVTIYNKVYALDAGLRITVTCNPAEAHMMERYSGEVMQFTLGSMAKDHVDKDAQTGFQDLKTVKQAVVMGGKKQRDGSESVYMAQLWISPKSVFTVEGEVTGGQVPDADTLLATIMKSVKQIKAEATPVAADVKTPEKKKPEEKPAAAKPSP